MYFQLLNCAFVFFAHASLEKKLLVIGDSLTEGYGVSKQHAYPALLEKKINSVSKTKWVVINAGNSGWTSASGLRQLRWQLKAGAPDVLILALGANDGLRGQDVQALEKNLVETLEEAKKNGIRIVLAGMKAPPNYGKKYIQEFEQTYKKVAQKTGATFIPFLLEGVAGESKLNLSDGIHPNEKGYEIVAETVFKGIKGLI